MNLYFLGLLVMILCFLYAKTVNQKALKLLDDKRKALLFTLFQEENKFKGLILVFAFVVYLLAIEFSSISYKILIGILFAFLVLYIIYTYYIKINKLKTNEFPIEYIKNFKIAAALQFGGILFLLFTSLFIY